jgi:Na+-driven multidrug efflux pump
MAPGAPQERGSAFLQIMAIGGFGTIFLAFAISVLRAVGATVPSLIIVALMSIATLVLEAAFVLGLFGLDPHGIEAAAWITVIVRAAASATLVWMITRRVRLRPPPGERFVNWAALKRQLVLGGTSALQQSVRPMGFIVLLALVASRFPGIGDDPSSAYTAVNIWIKLDAPTLMLAFAWGGGVAPVVGMALGARRPRYAARAAWSGVGAACMTAVVTMTLMLFFSGDLAALFIPDDPAAVGMTHEIFQFIAPVYVFMTAGIVIANAFNGAGDMTTPLVWDVAILLVVQSALALVWASPDAMGLPGLGLALLVSGVLQGVVPGLVLRVAKWKRHRGPGTLVT